jgi:hypothetical protein
MLNAEICRKRHVQNNNLKISVGETGRMEIWEYFSG